MTTCFSSRSNDSALCSPEDRVRHLCASKPYRGSTSRIQELRKVEFAPLCAPLSRMDGAYRLLRLLVMIRNSMLCIEPLEQTEKPALRRSLSPCRYLLSICSASAQHLLSNIIRRRNGLLIAAHDCTWCMKVHLRALFLLLLAIILGERPVFSFSFFREHDIFSCNHYDHASMIRFTVIFADNRIRRNSL